MTTKEKGTLLHELFPDETVRFIGYVEQAAKMVKDNPIQIRGGWKPKKMSAAGWAQIATDILEKIKGHREALEKDSKEFTRVLFEGYFSLFLKQCLQDYMKICPDFSFKLCIEAFFKL